MSECQYQLAIYDMNEFHGERIVLYYDGDLQLLLVEIHSLVPHLGAVSIRKTVLPGMAIPMLKIRRPNGRLIFNMEIAIRR